MGSWALSTLKSNQYLSYAKMREAASPCMLLTALQSMETMPTQETFGAVLCFQLLLNPSPLINTDTLATHLQEKKMEMREM